MTRTPAEALREIVANARQLVDQLNALRDEHTSLDLSCLCQWCQDRREEERDVGWPDLLDEQLTFASVALENFASTVSSNLLGVE